MKVEVDNKTEFKPIELKLTIESEKELCSLWHRLNQGRFEDIDDSINHGVSNDTELWEVLDELVESLNLKNK